MFFDKLDRVSHNTNPRAAQVAGSPNEFAKTWQYRYLRKLEAAAIARCKTALAADVLRNEFYRISKACQKGTLLKLSRMGNKP